MSLTSLLDNPDVKKRFRQEFKKPKLTVQKKLLAPPKSDRYSLVGTAFDYLLRFYIQRLNAHAIQKRWIAEGALDKVCTPRGGSYDIDTGELSIDEEPMSDKARNIFKKACLNHKQYLQSGRITDGLIKSSIYLAQLDVIYRSGFIDENLGVVHQEDILDLRKLIASCYTQSF